MKRATPPCWRALKGAMAAAAALALCADLPALAGERWRAAEDDASAVLPPLEPYGPIVAATMRCVEQRWTFELALGDGIEPAGGPVVLDIDRREFPTEAEAASGAIEIVVPNEALEPLRAGLRARFVFQGTTTETYGEPGFSLIGSRAAMTAMEEICSRPDMSAYRAVTFTPYSSYMNLARDLRADDIVAFSLATASEPELTVTMTELGQGRRLLFTKLCGSSWYFGASGCGVMGFALRSGAGSWRIALESEGVLLHLDEAHANSGWPDLVTLPLRGSGQPSRWRWTGGGYSLIAQ